MADSGTTAARLVLALIDIWNAAAQSRIGAAALVHDPTNPVSLPV